MKRGWNLSASAICKESVKLASGLPVSPPKAAFIVSVSRDLFISGIKIMVLPVFAGANALWFVMPVTVFLAMFYTMNRIKNYIKALSEKVI